MHPPPISIKLRPYGGLALLLGATAWLLWETSQINLLLAHSGIAFFNSLLAGFLLLLLPLAPTPKLESFTALLPAGFGVVVVLELAHAFAHPGSALLRADQNLAAQTWLLARLMESLCLLLAALHLAQRPPTTLWCWSLGGIAVAGLWLLWGTDLAPACYLPLTGQSPFKIAASYLIILLFLASLVLVMQRWPEDDFPGLLWVASYLALSILSELLNSLVAEGNSLANLGGHAAKTLALFLLFFWALQRVRQQPQPAAEPPPLPPPTTLAGNALLHLWPEPWLALDEQGCILDCNPSFAQEWAQEPWQLRGQPLAHLCPEGVAPHLLKQLEAIAAQARGRLVLPLQGAANAAQLGNFSCNFRAVQGKKLFLCQREQGPNASHLQHLLNVFADIPWPLFLLDGSLAWQWGNQACSLWQKEIETAEQGLWRHLAPSRGALRSQLEAHRSWQGTFKIKENEVIKEVVLELHPFQLSGVPSGILGMAQVREPASQDVAQLLQQEKELAIRHLVGGIAHDFNNQLYAMLLQIKLLHQNLAKDAFNQAYAAKALAAGEKVSQMIRQLRIFAGRHELQLRPVDLQEFLQRQLPALQALAPGNALTLLAEPGSYPIQGDAEQLSQLLEVLIQNAQEANPAQGAIHLSLRLTQVPPDTAHSLHLPPRQYVSLRVQDQGPGVALEHRSQIFDPFFSTKPKGAHAGMGLALAQGIARQHQGLLRLLPQGTGAQFELLLPLGGNQLPAKAQTDPSELFILLVDDEEMVAEGTALLLQSMGYQVHAVTNPQDALLWLRNNEVKPDLVLSDYAMGSINGIDLARQMHAFLPDLPLVIFSGFADAALHQQAAQAGVAEILPKPLTEEDLRTCLERLL